MVIKGNSEKYAILFETEIKCERISSIINISAVIYFALLPRMTKIALESADLISFLEPAV
jgi:hypothetical protein